MYEDCRVETTATVNGLGKEPIHEVRIRKAENGFIVDVGCKTFVAQTWKIVSDGLKLYYDSPKDAYEIFVRGNDEHKTNLNTDILLTA